MTDSIFETFADYLEQSDYPKGKKKIMESAVELFASNGYNGISTLQIAKNAGLSQATLFKYFKTKEELLVAILHPVVPGLFVNFFDDLLTYHKTEEMIHFLVRDRMAFLEKNQALFKIILQELLSGQKIKEEEQFIWEMMQSKLAAVHNRLLEDPRVNPDLTPFQLIRISAGPLIAYFGQLCVVGKNDGIREEEFIILEKQILAGLWK
ncbi:TetR/AcrR family transcriptional regulator [Streptococcus panodentis]|uniref:TetR/AcrR family transcriptional regulator n=1 Tax=Streptococcus panodentis TaxID=1581472 RepID=A0ABS5B0G7_9STRE|nr:MULTISPECIES: TetR/AcrR family transcriptional regulator [Streptococcus]KXT83586.1 Transcriptional regulator, TetR family [Streptococcus sp. DD11]MBP2622146.1 TetR/AcrR family transcriptional regulator [Streptococcus panodentis]